MSDYRPVYMGRLINTREEARDAAIDWQFRFEELVLSWQDVAEWGQFWSEVGEMFDLTDEFRENGIC